MRKSRLFLALLLAPAALGAQLFPRSASAEQDTQPQAAPGAVVVDSASPRASLLGYLNAARAGDFARAAQWIDRSYPETAQRAPELAKRLKAVLDAKLWLDLDRVSPRAAGDTLDGLPRDREHLGIIAAAGGKHVAVRLARVTDGDDVRWVFSAATLAQVDDLYAELPDNWIREHLPVQLLRAGPFDILYWQWIALGILIPLAAFIGWMLGPLTRSLMRRLVSKTDNEFDDRLVAAARGPIILIWAVVASRLLLRWLALAAPAHEFLVDLQQALLVVAVFWVILRAIGVMQETLPQAKWTETHPALRSLIPLGARIARLLVVAIALLTVLSLFGYPIATILAGLGIGGIAIALGSQKSLEHFFGSVSIGIDQPFRVGDWVSVSGTSGSIEAIGLRSTQIRTIDRTLVSIPNGQLAESKSENFGQRDRIRLNGTVGIEYGSSAATIRIIRDGIERILRAHPLTWPDRVQVRFSNFGAYSLDIEFLCWLQTPAIDEFREAREDVFLKIMELVEGNGASFAFPTQTVHVVRSGEGEAARLDPRGGAGSP